MHGKGMCDNISLFVDYLEYEANQHNQHTCSRCDAFHTTHSAFEISLVAS